MEAEELRQFSAEELKGRIRQWRDELFRSKFKSETTESKDNSVFRKLRRNIARGLTILAQKAQNAPVPAVTETVKSATPEDQSQVTATPHAESSVVEPAPKTAKKTAVKKPAAKKSAKAKSKE